MCGIFAVVKQANDKNADAANVVLEGLKRLEYRGYDSWGIAIKNGDKIVIEKHVGKIGQAKTNLPQAHIALGHTRWATHGGVTSKNAHPHLDCTQTLALVHNGIVENYQELKESLDKNHTFHSETDTEVALHLLEEKMRRLKSVPAIRQTFRQLIGMNAIIALSAKGDELIAAKNGSPLTVGLGNNANYIASDVWALMDHTNKVIFLEDGQLAHLTADIVTIYDIKTGKRLSPKTTTLDWQTEQSQLGKFHHYMEKEIHDQPKVLANISQFDTGSLDPLTKVITKARKTYLIGCGSAYFASLFGEYLLKSHNRDSEAVIGSESGKLIRLLNKASLNLMLSQSGETIDIIEAIDRAKLKGAPIAALTNVLGSTLYRKADHKILLQAGQEVAVASTKAFIAKLAVLIKIAYALNNRLSQGTLLISQSAKEVRSLLEGKSRHQIKSLATKLKDHDHMFVVGRGLAYPIAQETALKIKEVSYIHAEAYAGGELKHGTIALIEKGTPCIVTSLDKTTWSDDISAANEMKARGGVIIGIACQNHPVFDHYLAVPDLQEASAIPATTIVQLLAYDLSVARGLNPDKPRNLAKSVTVK